MKHLLYGAALACSALIAVGAQAETVNATASVYSTGSGSTPGVAFDVSSFSTIKISASGLVTLSPPFFNDPDGIGSFDHPHNITGVGGLSGISLPYAGGLVGVFLTATGPGPGDSEPASLGYGPSDLGFSSFSPLLSQVFFIGDGLTGDGTGGVQKFFVPMGAMRLVLGFADAPGYQGPPNAYYDNSGGFEVTVLAAVPETASWLMMLSGFGLIGGAARRRGTKRACQSDRVSPMNPA